MTSNLIVLIIAIITLGLIFAFILFWHYKRIYDLIESRQQDSSLQLIPQWLSDLRASMDRNSEFIHQQLAHTNQSINQRLEATAQLLRLLNKDLGQVHQVGQQMRDFQQFFRSPKSRGKIGEHIMKDTLLQVLPQSAVRFQYRFKNGSIVDALVLLEQGSIPIDAKFPLENFKKVQQAPTRELASSYHKEFIKDIRKHIDDIHRKYIQPDEGTLDFAVMYIPSETIYYELIKNETLLRESESKNVLFVAPNSFYYFLRLVLMGLYGQKIENTTRLLIQHFQSFERSTEEMGQELDTLLTHIINTKNAGDRLYTKYQDFERRLEGLINIETTRLD